MEKTSHQYFRHIFGRKIVCFWSLKYALFLFLSFNLSPQMPPKEEKKKHAAALVAIFPCLKAEDRRRGYVRAFLTV